MAPETCGGPSEELEDPMASRIIDSYENPVTQIKAVVEGEAIQLYTL